MAGKSRKISFYRLSIEKSEPIPGTNTHRIIELTNEEVEEHFKIIYENKMRVLPNLHKVTDVALSDGNDYVEVLEYSEHHAFIQIGQPNPSNTVMLRDKITLETENVPMKVTQLLELFTYCYIDFTTGIVSYISISGAPRVSTLRNLFDNAFLHTEGATAKLAVIMTHDVLETLMKKSTISKLTITVAVPEDQVLTDIGLDKPEFASIGNVRTRTKTYKIVGHRNRSLFKDSSLLEKAVEAIKSKFGGELKSLSANAKNDSEKSEEYDLLQEKFTKTVTFERDDIESLAPDDFKKILVETYNINKSNLVKYSRI